MGISWNVGELVSSLICFLVFFRKSFPLRRDSKKNKILFYTDFHTVCKIIPHVSRYKFFIILIQVFGWIFPADMGYERAVQWQ